MADRTQHEVEASAAVVVDSGRGMDMVVAVLLGVDGMGMGTGMTSLHVLFRGRQYAYR